MSTTFNPAQLATYAQARVLREYFNANLLGRGIPLGDDENGVTLVQNVNFPWLPPVPQKVGIYIPKWEGGPTAFEAPNGVNQFGEKLFFLHFLFNNGFTNNVGLCLDKFRRYPGQNAFVLNELNREIGA